MPKAITVAYVRNKIVWPIISKFVRLSESDEDGYGNCVTCGIKKHYKELQAGHFNPGRWNSIIFDVRGIHLQCYVCNVRLKGNPREYDKYMRARFGDEVVAELDQKAKEVVQFTVPELIALAEKYKPLVQELLQSKNDYAGKK